jgi:broad specificity phosphatase PhoE
MRGWRVGLTVIALAYGKTEASSDDVDMAIYSSPQKVTARLDALIQEIRTIQSPNMHGENHADVVVVAHGHILRAFTKRWLQYDLSNPFSMMLEPGGVGILR